MREIETQMSHGEFRQWQEFFAVEPPLVERVDLSGALVSTMLANIHRSPGASEARLADFMLVEQALKEERLRGDSSYVSAEQRKLEEEAASKRQLEMFILRMGGAI